MGTISIIITYHVTYHVFFYDNNNKSHMNGHTLMRQTSINCDRNLQYGCYRINKNIKQDDHENYNVIT